MMAGVYVIGIFFIALIGRICSWLAHRVLLMTSHTEHQIQTLFGDLDSGARELQSERETMIRLLSEASAGAWREGLSGRIDTALSLLSETAGSVTDQVKNSTPSSHHQHIRQYLISPSIDRGLGGRSSNQSSQFSCS